MNHLQQPTIRQDRLSTGNRYPILVQQQQQQQQPVKVYDSINQPQLNYSLLKNNSNSECVRPEFAQNMQSRLSLPSKTILSSQCKYAHKNNNQSIHLLKNQSMLASGSSLPGAGSFVGATSSFPVSPFSSPIGLNNNNNPNIVPSEKLKFQLHNENHHHHQNHSQQKGEILFFFFPSMFSK